MYYHRKKGIKSLLGAGKDLYWGQEKCPVSIFGAIILFQDIMIFYLWCSPKSFFELGEDVCQLSLLSPHD